MVKTLVDVQDVSLTYRGMDGSLKEAVRSASFTIAEKEFVSIIGPSGCGKTTLLKVLGDLLQPSSGKVLIDGEPPTVLRRRREIGYMFQSSVLLPWLTIGANIEMLAKIAGRPITSQSRQELADLVGLGTVLSRYPHELSGGMQQRAAIARALALDPTMLLMDEPFGALDEITRRRMNLELLSIWHQRRKTAVFITHSIEEAVFLSDRILVMATNPGRIVADVQVPLERPRLGEMRYDQRMTDLVEQLYTQLEEAESAHLDSQVLS